MSYFVIYAMCFMNSQTLHTVSLLCALLLPCSFIESQTYSDVNYINEINKHFYILCHELLTADSI
jgi:hypothetical protein